MRPYDSSLHESSNVFDKDLEFQDQEMAKKRADGLGHSSETHFSLSSSETLVGDTDLN